MTSLVVQLRPLPNDARSFHQRMLDAKAMTAGVVGVEVTAVVVRLVPAGGDVPDAARLRAALKILRRRAGLAATWATPPVRPGRAAKPRRTRAQRTAKP